METTSYSDHAARWLSENYPDEPQEIAKPTQATRAWFATIDGRDVFIKWYPFLLRESWVKVEAAIAGSNLHPAIIPLRHRVDCMDGTLLIYNRIGGENLGPPAGRTRFSALPLAERAAAVITVAEALTVICKAGFMVVDWYYGNTIYDFDARQVWLFDWELCRKGGSFILDMDSNYGSSSLMAPEEFVRGSRLDEITLVYNLGRYVLLTLPQLADTLAPLIARATYPARFGRYRSMDEFVAILRLTLQAEC